MKLDFSMEEKLVFLVSASKRMGLSLDDVLAVYLLLGDKIFFLFDLWQGKTIKFPSMRSFHHNLTAVDKLEVLRLTKPHYLINGVDSYIEDIVPGDSVCIDGTDVEAMSKAMVFLEDSYILIKRDKKRKE